MPASVELKLSGPGPPPQCITPGTMKSRAVVNGVLYVGGHFDNVCTGDTDGPTNGFHCPAGSVGATRHKLVAVVPDTTSTLGFRVDPWDPGANSPLGVFAFSSDGSGLQVGGEFTSIGNFTRQQAYAEFSANTAPVAAFTSTCSALACSFDARSSTDAEGTLAGYKDLTKADRLAIAQYLKTIPAVSNRIPRK